MREESGFIYYIDHDRQTSTWENPLVPHLRRTPALLPRPRRARARPLPLGVQVGLLASSCALFGCRLGCYRATSWHQRCCSCRGALASTKSTYARLGELV